MLLVQAMDEGALLAQGIHHIGMRETNTTLTTSLIELSDELLRSILTEYIKGSIVPYEQSEQGPEGMILTPSYSHKLTKEDGILDFTKTADVLEREVRAYNEWPRSRTLIGDVEITITAAHADVRDENRGAYFTTTEGALAFSCADQTALIIDCLKPSGKKEMTSQEFLRGYGHRLEL